MFIVDQRSAVGLAHTYGEGSADVKGAVREAIDWARACNAAFIDVTETRALEESRAAAARWREKRPASALDGACRLPRKDLFDVAGTVSNAGSALFRAAGRPATADAPLASQAPMQASCTARDKPQRVRVFGLGLNCTSVRRSIPLSMRQSKAGIVFSVPSSGAAIAVAAGVVPIAVGTDTPARYAYPLR